ncbi:hypothetical protein LOK49_LG14G01419 [Camellia lanceoleosa]|uniref:Uncharacterized protein n=1 Tax=Camellia lanceoleosa TaxID=1840588 RepID=A0ACC0F9P4_9ERIC|nr:hypothetical protein LOK49_LG14G01419 [Camellia lanceoleosa]
MDPLCPDDETDSEFRQFIDDQIDTIPQDFEELKNGTLPNVADSKGSANTMKIVLRFHRIGHRKKGNFTENMNVISYMSHGSSGGGCTSGGSEVAGPFVKCANEISYGGSGGAVRSFTKYGFLVQYGNGMNVWRWMGGSATATRARAEPKALRKKKKRKCIGQVETEACIARHEHQRLKSRKKCHSFQ